MTAGSPYYNPHLQRPALFPPTDGYQPPEDPLRGVARQIEATAQLKAAFPDLLFVGSAYSYLQEWLPNVAPARACARGAPISWAWAAWCCPTPSCPRDVLAGRPLDRKRICRTFSDCTTAPRKRPGLGLLSARPVLRKRPEAAELKEFKLALRA